MAIIDSKYLDKIKDEINQDIHKLINVNQKPSGGKKDEGWVERFADGIGLISGLEDARIGQKVAFPISTKRANGEEIFGQIIDIEEEKVSCIVFGEERFVKEGDLVVLDTAEDVLSVFASEALLGHVVDPFGKPLDIPELTEEDERLRSYDHSLELNEIWENISGKKGLNYKFNPIERDAPPLISREAIKKPLLTGIKAIDTMLPVGLGQRMLIIGDRGTGKTSVAITAMLNQAILNKNRDEKDKIIFIYVAIGKKISEIVSIKKVLDKAYKSDDKSIQKDYIIVATKANDPASLLYIAPFSGCSIGEYFRDQGKHAVIVYDDLTRHANAYRHISLLLKRAPGREAFPGDIFYLHSRLLERAASVLLEKNENGELVFAKMDILKNKNESDPNKKPLNGTLTAFPIIETKENDFSAFIPTNVISITDGQIFLDYNLFNEEVLPPIHTGLSVSRVGGKAQNGIMKKLSKNLKADIAVYKEKKKYQSFGFDLTGTDKILVNHGERCFAYLKQTLYNIAPEKEQLLDLSKIEIQKLIEEEHLQYKIKNDDKNIDGNIFSDSSNDPNKILELAFKKYVKAKKIDYEELKNSDKKTEDERKKDKEEADKLEKHFEHAGFKSYFEFKELIIKDSKLISFISEFLKQNANN